VPYAVITRDLEGAAPYAAALEPLGLEVVVMPVTRTEPPRDPDALTRVLAAGGYAAIVCASARAAAALIRARPGIASAALPEVWCVGPATARVLEQAGIAAIVPPTARDGLSLAHAMRSARELTGRRVLVPRAEDGRDDGIELLRDHGVTVDDVVAYRTIAVAAGDPEIARGRELLGSGEAAVCAVFAPSQVAALDAIVGIKHIRAVFAAIGATTAIALEEAGAEAVAIAQTPTPAGIANAIAAVYPPRT
jgi:uroporphyrinogen-III synthase